MPLPLGIDSRTRTMRHDFTALSLLFFSLHYQDNITKNSRQRKRERTYQRDVTCAARVKKIKRKENVLLTVDFLLFTFLYLVSIFFFPF